MHDDDAHDTPKEETTDTAEAKKKVVQSAKPDWAESLIEWCGKAADRSVYLRSRPLARDENGRRYFVLGGAAGANMVFLEEPSPGESEERRKEADEEKEEELKLKAANATATAGALLDAAKTKPRSNVPRTPLPRRRLTRPRLSSRPSRWRPNPARVSSAARRRISASPPAASSAIGRFGGGVTNPGRV